jgi:uncharacterized membrane protein YdjX (TVP38/TMEM64 family)
MEAPEHMSVPPAAKAGATLLGGVGLLILWRLTWFALVWRLSGLHPDLSSFMAHREEFEAWNAAQPWAAWTAFLVAYTLICALCLDGTATLVAVAGALFGGWKGLAACTLGSSLGALASFLFARRFLGGWLHRSFPKAMARVDRGLKADGDVWLLSARLIPMVSFSLVNLGLGVSPMKARRFLLLSTLGLLPCNAAYAWAGVHLGGIHRPHDLLSPSLWAILCAVGLLPLLLRYCGKLPAVLKRRR